MAVTPPNGGTGDHNTAKLMHQWPKHRKIEASLVGPKHSDPEKVDAKSGPKERTPDAITPKVIKESQSSCDFGWLGLGFLRGGHEMRSVMIADVVDLQMRREPVGYWKVLMGVLG